MAPAIRGLIVGRERMGAPTNLHCRSSPWNRQAAHYRRPGGKHRQGTVHAREIPDADQIAGAVEADEVAHPGEHRHVGDSVGTAHEPATCREARLQYLQQAPRFGDVAIARALVFVVATGELVEKTHLTEHRPDPA